MAVYEALFSEAQVGRLYLYVKWAACAVRCIFLCLVAVKGS